MQNFASRLLRSLGFERLDEAAVEATPDVDLSSAVELGSNGHAQVPLHKVVGTAKFRRQVELLGEIADAHRGGIASR